MLSQKYRLKSRSAFNYVYKKGRTAGSPLLALVYSPTKYPARIGFSASKKVGNSVQRNRAKRLMREAVRSLIDNFDKGNNYIFVARDAILNAKFDEVKSTIERLIKSQKLWKGAARGEV